MVERNLAKVEVESSRLFSRSNSKGSTSNMLPFFIEANQYLIMSVLVAFFVSFKFMQNTAR